MLEDRLMIELGRSPPNKSSFEGIRLAVMEGEEEAVDGAVETLLDCAKPCRVLLMMFEEIDGGA